MTRRVLDLTDTEAATVADALRAEADRRERVARQAARDQGPDDDETNRLIVGLLGQSEMLQASATAVTNVTVAHPDHQEMTVPTLPKTDEDEPGDGFRLSEDELTEALADAGDVD